LIVSQALHQLKIQDQTLLGLVFCQPFLPACYFFVFFLSVLASESLTLIVLAVLPKTMAISEGVSPMLFNRGAASESFISLVTNRAFKFIKISNLCSNDLNSFSSIFITSRFNTLKDNRKNYGIKQLSIQ